ncbi:MAG: hypothetical protein M0Q38_00005, partial [Bacteroidales bacterium]|nr:hypothetical protein [Bacteroidales bacterium]
MKTKIFTRLLHTVAMSFLFSSVIWAQVPSGYQCSIRNDSLTSSTVYEFDIYLLNTDLVNVFEYDLFQAGILVNSSIVNGGAITASIVTSSSQLVASQQPASITFAAAQNCIKLGPGGILPHGSATIISTTSPGTRIARIRLTNTVAFGQFSPNFSFNFTSSPYNTVVTAYNQTSPFLGVNITNAANHTVTTMTNPILNAPVMAFAMTGGGGYCQGSTGVVVSLSGSETGVNYKLVQNTIPVGSNIPGTGSALSFGNQLAGTYTASAYRKATYLASAMNGSVTAVQTTINPTLAGPAAACIGTAGNVYTTETGMTNYSWTVSAGGTMTAGGTSLDNTVTVTWNTLGAQSIDVNYTNSGCTAASPTSYPVTVNSRPVPTLAGANSLCEGTAGVVYTTEAGMTNYVWTVSTGGTITAGGTSTSNTATITWNTAGPQTVTVDYTNASGCNATTPTSYSITVNAKPVPTIAGNNNVCAGTTGVIYTTESGQTNYIWSVSAGGLITTGGTTSDNTVTVTWNTVGPQSVSINYNNAAGCSANNPVNYPVTVVAVPNPIISGLNSVCQGSTGIVYTTEAGKTNYVWTVSAGGTITSGGTTIDNTATVTWNTTGAQSMSVNYSNGVCLATTPTFYPVVVNVRPVPTISGTNTVCTGTAGVVYTTEAGMTGYVWNVSAGGTVTAGGTANDNTVTVTWNTPGAQSVSINYTSGSCNAVNPTIYAVTVGSSFSATISGNNAPCVGSTGVIYTTEAGMTNYIWTVSAGGTITSGGTSTSNTVTVTWNSAGPESISVNYTNGICTPTTPTVYMVSVKNIVGTPTAITVSAGTEPTCQLINGTTTTTYATTATDNAGFNWSVSNALAGSISPSTGIMMWTNGFSGSVDIQVTANGCSGPSAQIIRIVNITPTVGTPTAITISAGSDPTCQLTNGTTTTTYATTATNNTGFNWTISNSLAGTVNATTGVMTWANGFSGTVDIRVTANGCNGPSAMVIHTVNITQTVGMPTAITISAGAEPTCQLTNGTTTTTYATTATNNTGFNWSVSNTLAGTINAITGVMTWANGFTGSVDIQVTTNGCNGPSAQVIRTVNITPTVGMPTAITVSAGTEPTCQLTNGTSTTTYATTATNSTGFNWSVSNALAGTINATTGVMVWANGFSGSVDIQVAANGCSGPSAQVIRTVNITPTVGTPTAITISAGSDPTCQLTNGTTTTTYATTATNSTGFNWSVSNALAGTINATIGVMAWANGFSGSVDIQVTANGCNGPSAQVIRTVNITPTVGTPTAITVSAGIQPSCQLTNGTSTTTYATTATNNTGFNWSVSNALAGTINPTTGVMTWTNGFAGNVNIQVTANGCNGPSVQTARAVTISPTVGTPTAITVSAGIQPTCQLTNGTTTTTYATTATNNTGFNWSVSNALAGTINAITGVMTWANGFSGSVDIQVTANGCNGPSAQVIRTVNITPTVGTPTIITVSAGTEPACQLTNGTTMTTYATTATNNTSFNWTISNILAGTINATTGVMTWNSGFSGSVDIQVTANGCNGPSAQVIRTVNITPTVGTPTAITISAGTEPTCQLTNGTTTTTYATTATNNTGFNWSVSNALAGTINATTGVMTWANGFSGSVDIQVTANGCNGPSTQVIRIVNITPTVGTPTAITVSNGTEPTCQLTNGTTTTTYTSTATNNTGINWTISNALAGSINTSTGVMTWVNGFSGSVDIQVTANGCNGPSAQVIRTVNITPTVGMPTIITVSAGTEPACQLTNGTTATTYATTATNSTGFNWSVSNALAGTINATTGVMTWNSGFLGSVDIQVTANGCNGPSTQVIRTVNITPTVGTPTAITVSTGTEPTCQLTIGTTTTTYATTATNNTGFNWSASNALAGTINATTGVMTWANGFSG